MPRCAVYGPRDVDVVSVVMRELPSTVITMVDEIGAITGVFQENPTDKLISAGLHVTLLEKDVNSVVWRPFYVRDSVGSSAGTEDRIAEILRQRFNARPSGERSKFLLPILVLPLDGSAESSSRARREYYLLMQVLERIERVLEENGIDSELGLASW